MVRKLVDKQIYSQNLKALGLSRQQIYQKIITTFLMSIKGARIAEKKTLKT